MYFILEGDDKLKNKFNEYVRICLLIIVIALIGISYTIYYAFCHNGEVVYRSYGIDQVIAVNPSLSFLQILVIVILGLALVGAILFLVYTHAGKKSPEELLKNQEKSIFFVIETVLFTILLALIIIIPTNILLEKNNTSDNYQNRAQENGNAISWNRYN